MHTDALRRHRVLNVLQTLILLIGMSVLLGALGWFLAGMTGVILAVGGVLILLLFGPRVSPQFILRLYRAQDLDPRQMPALFAILQRLVRRAGLPSLPHLYYLPSPLINAFAVGSREASAIALTDGLLRALNMRELTGVLAHELSHIRNNDMHVMGLADLFSRVTSALSTTGQLLLLINLPMMLVGGQTISWFVVLLLLFAPVLSALIQSALSRAREYDADIGAVELTGDANGLASALGKIEHYQGRLLEQIFMPGRRVPDPSLLRTHPPTEDRVRRLRTLQTAPASVNVSEDLWYSPIDDRYQRRLRPRPRWHMTGIWY